MISFKRIRERMLVRWGLAYLGGAWLVLQVLNALGGTYGWPRFLLRAAPAFLAVGLLIALVLAWYHGERGAQRVSRVEFGLLAGLLALASVVAFFVGRGGDAPALAVAPGLQTVSAPVDEATIAVLPFENMSSDPEQEFFSDGLTEELLNVLAQVPGLRVAARTSSFVFKDAAVAVDSIGRALHVAYVVEGSVRKAGNRIRITAQLIHAASGYHRWSQTYDRDLADVFAVQEEISRAIAAELQLRVAAEDRPLARGTDDPGAHALLLRAVQTNRQSNSAEAWAEVERLLRAALARDPAYARAHAMLARVHVFRAYVRAAPPEQAYARARAAAGRALALDSSEAEAHTVLGVIASRHDWDFAAAEAHHRRALEINPNDARVLANHAWLLAQLGRTEEALREARRAVDIDPLSAGAHNDLGAIYGFHGDHTRAIEQLRVGLALAPDASWLLGTLAFNLAAVGRTDEAVRVAERALALAPDDPYGVTVAAYAHARAGHRADVTRLLGQLSDEGAFYARATVEAGLGNADVAFALLGRAVAAREDSAPDLGVDPAFADLRGDPRMRRLLQRIGLG